MARNNPDSNQTNMSRRKPSQKRAIATVEAILEATIALIALDGFAELNTNKIAEYAGVSIGSLYQYFPNKEAIANRLYEDTISKIAFQARAVIFNRVNDDIEQTLPILIDTVLELYESNEIVLIRLVDEAPELKKTAQSLSLEILIHSANRVYIAQHYSDVPPSKMDVAIYFACTTFLEHIRKYVFEKPEEISRNVFINNLTRMITCYLKDQQRNVTSEYT